jgi:hypothetical protein
MRAVLPRCSSVHHATELTMPESVLWDTYKLKRATDVQAYTVQAAGACDPRRGKGQVAPAHRIPLPAKKARKGQAAPDPNGNQQDPWRGAVLEMASAGQCAGGTGLVTVHTWVYLSDPLRLCRKEAYVIQSLVRT